MNPDDLKSWLVHTSLPIWSRHGIDRNFGGFHEKLNFDLTPCVEPHRARLTARQIYCFATGHDLGWPGDATALVAHGIDFLKQRLVLDDGTVLKAIDPKTDELSPGHDAYDYAFVLFSLAAAARAHTDKTQAEALARQISKRLTEGWGHPIGGFNETMPPTRPLRSNPHMHLFEAFLEWVDVSADADGYWRDAADAIANLALNHMLLENGAMPEHFDEDWRAIPDTKGVLVEPGHQFEWAWLLARWARMMNSEETFRTAQRLVEIGETWGVDPRRGIAVNELTSEFEPRDESAKLWPQTERAKAWYEMATNPMSSPELKEHARTKLPEACGGIGAYFEGAPPGLWREVMLPDGSFVEEPVRASSLYHIVCAIRTISQPTEHSRS